MLCLASGKTDLFAGTSTRSVLKRPLSGIVSAPEWENGFPDRFSLQQNYPNPFNPSTQIRFAITESGYVTLEIFDVKGGLVARLVNNYLERGTYTVQWNATNSGGESVGSGVYFYRLRSARQVDVKRMLYLR